MYEKNRATWSNRRQVFCVRQVYCSRFLLFHDRPTTAYENKFEYAIVSPNYPAAVRLIKAFFSFRFFFSSSSRLPSKRRIRDVRVRILIQFSTYIHIIYLYITRARARVCTFTKCIYDDICG